MERTFLPLEKPIEELQQKIEALKNYDASQDSGVDFQAEITQLEKKLKELTVKIYSNLKPWQVTSIARHPDRPYVYDYISLIFTDFQELYGDRAFANDFAIVGGLARLDGKPVMIIGHNKGRTTAERNKCNFGMPSPEGYRKALRLAKMAEQFNIPVITFIDTPGAYPGIGSEERNQSEAIARNLREFANLKTPVIVNIIGEGGSGGALAIGVGDYVNMLQMSIYSVISPEGCASILWKSSTPDKVQTASEILAITAQRNLELGLIDTIIPEPEGCAHSDYETTAKNIKAVITKQLDELQTLSKEELETRRFDRILKYGTFSETEA